MTAKLNIEAEQVRDWAAQARYVMMAARSLEQGAPTNPHERMECMLYMMELAEDLSKRAEQGADALAHTLFKGV